MKRGWKEPDWDQPRPSPRELTDSWASVSWEPSPVDHPAVDRYLEEVRHAFTNGDRLVGRWRATGYDDVTAWFMARNRLDEYEMHRLLFSDATIRNDLAALRIPETLDRVPGGLREEWAGSLVLDGLLAGLIVDGGAYASYTGPASEAKQLAQDAVSALTGQRYEDFRVDLTHEAWTPWFRDVAWDWTIVLTDMAKNEMTVLCITDTD